MLKLILEAGYVDPEVLQELNEEQKEMLFEKLRQEQLRKWRIREEELLMKERAMPAKPPKKPKINFLEGSDGRPWVWVMGEHPDDLPYEELVRKKEAKEEEKRRESVRKEAEELAKLETRDILLADDDSSKPLAHSESFMDTVMAESPDGIRKAKVIGLWQKAIDNRTTLVQSMTEEEKQAYEKRRADELHENMLKSNEVKMTRAADVAMEALRQWRESEEKAKALEKKHKISVSKAKEKVKGEVADEEILASIPDEKKKQLTRKLSEKKLGTKAVEQKVEEPVAKGKEKIMLRWSSFVAKDTKPKSIDHAIKWFREQEAPKGVGRESDGSISLWFHGPIKRDTADTVLQPKPSGMYLVRLSHKVWGYTISVKVTEAVKHYVVDVSTPNVYKFIGKQQPEFPSLKELLKYYRRYPVTWKGKEVLLLACEQSPELLLETKALYQDTEEAEE
ncbi:PREDICTED: SH2 domain-containing protein 4B-like [Amphimedon queenslandica]|uniref:SH2 domain-containing protein n=1 Tax=Amphimedon queenslandica TaxID=400682 RepID=A0A1X7V1V0_AMPQE|nr:PREDICTED: SH2 domain-containing protein 4B-like [Amphimedon queenslandica]|eukprot:XP_011403562.1 PREDICTED: SH2 domain-containing protein 4B-like [Amphimedon queenslandica]